MVAEKVPRRIPSSREEMKKLPDIGNYIASEVLLTAYEKSERCGKNFSLIKTTFLFL